MTAMGKIITPAFMTMITLFTIISSRSSKDGDEHIHIDHKLKYITNDSIMKAVERNTVF